MAARGAEYAPQSSSGYDTNMMGPTITLERNNVVKFDNDYLLDAPRSPIKKKIDSQHSRLHRRTSSETRTEQEILDMPQNTREGLFARVLSYKWKSDAKDKGKDSC